MNVLGMRLRVEYGRYRFGGGVHVALTEPSGEPYCTLSVNVEGVELADDEFVLKDYSENAVIAAKVLTAGALCKPTGRVVTLSQWVRCPVVRLCNPRPTFLQV